MLHETQLQTDERFMREALQEAIKAVQKDEVPIGAVIVANGRIIAKAHNMTETLHDVTAHAEMQAITAASDFLGGKYLTECTLYVTVEPCPMCAGALGWSQIKRIVYGTSDSKRGYTTILPELSTTYHSDSKCKQKHRSPLHPKTIVDRGILEDECREIMQQFFCSKRR